MLPIGQIVFDPTTLKSLHYFNNLVRKIIQSSDHGQYEYRLYPIGRAFGPSWSGQYYCLTDKGWGDPFKGPYVFFGLDFEADPVVCVWLDEDWARFLIPPLRGQAGRSLTYSGIVSEGADMGFLLLPDHYSALVRCQPAEQEALLRRFFVEANERLEKLLGEWP